ncbi:MAG: ferrous iron transport protein A, partial [Candidatus Omnitrophica bacterium]|nr:ferrous iron transport protein A [Candidatus Omnitrophota bacterium]
MKRIDLIQMRMREAGVVVEIQGGYGIQRRMYALGVRPGKRLIKVSSQLWRGPVTVEVD